MRVKQHTTLAIVLTLALVGCAASPWAMRKPADRAKPAPSQDADKPAQQIVPSANSQAIRRDPEALGRFMAEVQQSGVLDKADQDKLTADLQQTDPSLWPLVVQQFRAAVAYRRQSEQHTATPADQASAGAPSPLPPVDGGSLLRSLYPLGTYPATPFPSSIFAANATNMAYRANRIGEQTPDQQPNPVVPASYNATEQDWLTSLQGAIRSMEADAAKNGASQDDLAVQVKLRMLYLTAGRRDAALQPIASADPATREFWSKQMYGLDTWLDARRTPDAQCRAAETKRILGDALSSLGESSPLVVRNLAFCTDVLSYGCVKQFKSNDFLPDQDVILYFELENFSSESTPKGFHTRLKSSYQIFDGRGQRVSQHEFPISEEYCQNPRRDFFIACQFRMPGRIYPGKHTLQLTVEDLQGRKIGQSTIDLTIKDAESEKGKQ
jgi:hypothetical protein